MRSPRYVCLSLPWLFPSNLRFLQYKLKREREREKGKKGKKKPGERDGRRMKEKAKELMKEEESLKYNI